MSLNTPAVGAITLAGMWQASVYGIQVETIVVATGFTLLGALARVGLEMAKAADVPGGVRWSSVFALFGGSMASATTISVVFLALLKVIGIQSDSITLLGLVFFGFVGPKSILWLFSTASTTITKKTGLKLPAIGPDGGLAP